MNSLERTVRAFKRGLGLTSASPVTAAMRPAYDGLLNVLYGRRGLKRVINGDETVVVRPPHRYTREDYEPAVYAALRSSVREGAVVLDIGAHVGLFTIVLARWAGPSGRIYAFEPAPSTRAALEDHLRLNDVRERVTVVPLAVSDVCQMVTFHAESNPRLGGENTLSNSHSRVPTAQSIEVMSTTVDAFCTRHRLSPTLIKIDIEGFEFHALRGARETLSRCRARIVVELHPMNWPEIGVDPARASQLITELGYRTLPLEGQANPFAEYGHVVLEPLTGAVPCAHFNNNYQRSE